MGTAYEMIQSHLGSICQRQPCLFTSWTQSLPNLSLTPQSLTSHPNQTSSSGWYPCQNSVCNGGRGCRHRTLIFPNQPANQSGVVGSRPLAFTLWTGCLTKPETGRLSLIFKIGPEIKCGYGEPTASLQRVNPLILPQSLGAFRLYLNRSSKCPQFRQLFDERRKGPTASVS